MLKWFRSRASATAPILLLSLAALALPHGGESAHDADGDFALVFAHDANGHGVGAPSTTEEPDHCAICHFSRQFRPLTQIALVAAAFDAASAFASPDVPAVALADSAAQPPLRAPPISPDNA